MKVVSVIEQLLFSTVRIETVSHSGLSGSGTGFIYTQYLPDGKTALFVVTNKHVIASAEEMCITFTKTESESNKPVLGDVIKLRILDFQTICFDHPNSETDITLIPLYQILDKVNENLGCSAFYRSVGSALIPSPEILETLDALEEVVFVGYPNNIYDTKNYLPIIRKGITATAISVDFLGRPQFLIDASVFPGSSGSPVFIYNSGSYLSKGGEPFIGQRIYFVGVISSGYYRDEFNKVTPLPIPTANSFAISTQMIDLGLVIKAEAVQEAAKECVRHFEGT